MIDTARSPAVGLDTGPGEGQAGYVKPNDLGRLIDKLVTSSTELAVVARLERDLYGPGTEAAAAIDGLLPSLVHITQEARDLQVCQAISVLPERAEPYSVKELAHQLGTDVDTVRRVLALMIQDGVAEPDD